MPRYWTRPLWYGGGLAPGVCVADGAGVNETIQTRSLIGPTQGKWWRVVGAVAITFLLGGKQPRVSWHPVWRTGAGRDRVGMAAGALIAEGRPSF